MAVTSLHVQPESGLILTQYPGRVIPANRGDLLLDYQFTIKEVKENESQSWSMNHVKDSVAYLRPAVSSIRSTSAKYRVTGETQLTNGGYAGNIILGDPSDVLGVDLAFEAIHLQGVEETLEREAIGLSFPVGRSSTMISRILMPSNMDIDEFDLQLHFGILASKSGTIPQDILSVSYRIIEPPSQDNQIVPAFSSNTLDSVACNFGVTVGSLSSYYTVTSDKILGIKAGSLVFVKMTRAAQDAYPDRIILLKKTGRLSI